MGLIDNVRIAAFSSALVIATGCATTTTAPPAAAVPTPAQTDPLHLPGPCALVISPEGVVANTHQPVPQRHDAGEGAARGAMAGMDVMAASGGNPLALIIALPLAGVASGVGAAVESELAKRPVPQKQIAQIVGAQTVRSAVTRNRLDQRLGIAISDNARTNAGIVLIDAQSSKTNQQPFLLEVDSMEIEVKTPGNPDKAVGATFQARARLWQTSPRKLLHESKRKLQSPPRPFREWTDAGAIAFANECRRQIDALGSALTQDIFYPAPDQSRPVPNYTRR